MVTKLTWPPGGQIEQLRPLFIHNITPFIKYNFVCFMFLSPYKTITGILGLWLQN